MSTRQSIAAITLLLSANANAEPQHAAVSESLSVNALTQTGLFIGLSAEQSDVQLNGQELNRFAFTVFISDVETGETASCFAEEVLVVDEILSLNNQGTGGAVTVFIDPATCSDF